LNSAVNRLRVLMVDHPLRHQIHLNRLSQKPGPPQYAGVYIDTARIIQQLAVDAGFSLLSADNIRAMRSSAQHGGSHELAETRLILERR
jgi:hypothetical protein